MPLNVLGEVAKASGKNDKLKILKANSGNKELAELLDAVFNYNRRFWVNKFDMPAAVDDEDTQDKHTDFLHVLNQLETRQLTGNNAKEFSF